MRFLDIYYVLESNIVVKQSKFCLLCMTFAGAFQLQKVVMLRLLSYIECKLLQLKMSLGYSKWILWETGTAKNDVSYR